MLLRGKQPSRVKVGFPGQFPGPPSPHILALGRAGRLEVAGRQEHPTSEGFGEELDSLTSTSASGSGSRTPKIPREAAVSRNPRRLRGAPPRPGSRGTPGEEVLGRVAATGGRQAQTPSPRMHRTPQPGAGRGCPWQQSGSLGAGNRPRSGVGGGPGRDSRGAGTRAE